jgi:hypothetical protein
MVGSFTPPPASVSPIAVPPLQVLMAALSSSGVLAKLDELWVAQPTSSASLAGLIHGTVAVSHGTMTFVPNVGFYGDASTGYIDTTLTPGSGNLSLNSASIGAVAQNIRAAAQDWCLIGAQSSSQSTDLFPWDAGTSGFAEVCSNSAGFTNSTGAFQGFWITSRNASTGNTVYFNGASFATVTQASSAIPNESFYVAAKHGPGSMVNPGKDLVGAWFVGGALTATDVSNFNTAMAAYINAVTTWNYLYFCAPAAVVGIKVLGSNDGVNYFAQPISTVGQPACTPSVLYYNNQIWMVSNFTNTYGAGAQQHYLNVGTMSLTGLGYTQVAQIDFTGAIGSGSSAAVWPGCLFQDPYDGSVHAYNGASADQSSDAGFIIYETHPTNRAWTAWSVPAAVTISGIPNNAIDCRVFNVGGASGTYYLLYKNENTKYVELASGTSSTGVLGVAWTVIKTGNWAGWGQPFEAPDVHFINGQWLILLDAQGAGIYQSVLTGTGFTATGYGGGTWSAPALINLPAVGFTPQHGMLLPTPAGWNNGAASL